MLRTLFSFFCLLVSSILLAQNAPEAFNWQGVIRDTNGDPVNNQNINIQININENTATGTTVYTETHAVTTSINGLVSLVIGEGTTTDNFSTISWGDANYFLNIAVDLTGGTMYSDLGTIQLISVPYALHSNTSESTNTLKDTSGNTEMTATSNGVRINSGLFETFAFTNGKMTTSAAIPNFGNNLQLEFKDGTNINRISNVFPNVTSLPTPGNVDYKLNLNVRGNETLSARGDGTVRINNAYTFPNTDGTTGQAFVTDGNGNITWGNASSLTDADGDTKIQVEESNNEDLIRFDMEGIEYFRMNKGRLETVNNGLSVFIGENAGLNDDLNTHENVAIGYKSLETNVGAGANTAVGAFSLNQFNNGSSNTAIGIGALQSLRNGNNNVAIGAAALSTAVGSLATGNGSNNVAIGFRAGLNNSGKGNIFLGADTDISGNVSDRLVIDNSNTTAPLIYGEFNNNLARINGDFETIGNATTTGTTMTGTLKVGSSSTLSGIYKVAISRNVGNVGGNNGRVETFTVNGASPGDVAFVSPSESLSGQIVIAQCWVSANNTVSVRFRNTDGGSRDPDGGDGATYYISVIK